MNLLLYFIVAVLVTAVGAVPLGTVNISVIHTTLTANQQKAMKIALAAGIAEIILSFYALHCNTMVTTFINMNQWIQVLIALVLLAIGSLLFFKKNRSTREKKFKLSTYATGLLLGLLNPPVLVYWLFVMSYLNENSIELSVHAPLPMLIIFFTGVFLGKIGTLYGYSRMSLFLKNKVQNITNTINRLIGVLLLIIGSVQFVKYMFA